MGLSSEAVFLVVCDPFMNDLWATKAILVNELYGSKFLVFLVVSHSQNVDLWASFVGQTFKRKSRSQLCCLLRSTQSEKKIIDEL